MNPNLFGEAENVMRPILKVCVTIFNFIVLFLYKDVGLGRREKLTALNSEHLMFTG
jgi:hypothetical protein